MIFLSLLPAPIPLFQYLKITHRTIFMSILVEESCTGYLAHLFRKGHRQSDRASFHWLQMDVQPG